MELKMNKNFSIFRQKLQLLCISICHGVGCLVKSICVLFTYFFRFLLLRVNPFWIQLFYFVSFSFLGFCVLMALKPRTEDTFKPGILDLFFTSVSAATVSSMSTVEMEVFSNAQLLVLTLLMFVGGEVFTSTVGLQLRKYKLKKLWNGQDKVASVISTPTDQPSPSPGNNIELGQMERAAHSGNFKLEASFHIQMLQCLEDNELLKYYSIKYLGYVVLGYLVVVHVVGVAMVSLYLAAVSGARNALKSKGLKLFTFSLFTTVSTFASCGFVPTNENMVVFRNNSGLLILLIPQILLGNTLFPSCLRFTIWFIGKFFKREESSYLLKNSQDAGFLHLLPALHSYLLVLTVLGFIALQFLLFSSMDWNSDALSGMNAYEKLIGVLFQSVNARHTGETIVDISTISSAVVVLFVVMMYLPPYTSFLPVKEKEERKRKRKGKVAENLVLSQLSYLVIFVILVCITERKSIKEDPLNFNVLNIVVEVISAYGNVGFTMGYSCKRQIHGDGSCVDKWYGFVGRWSDEGKVILILVMFFGRLKKFNMEGGQAWKLL